MQTITLTATVLAGDFIETAIESAAQTKIIGVQCQDLLIGLYCPEQPIGQRKLAIDQSAIWLIIPAPDIVFFDDVKTFGRFDAAGSNIGLDKLSRKTNKIRTRVVSTNSKEVLHGFIADNVVLGATVYTDEHASYKDMPYYDHEYVTHSAKQFVDGMAHTNGMESFWALLKRGYHGTFHKMSEKHLHRYINEFATRQNLREEDTLEIMKKTVGMMVGKRLTYKQMTEGKD